jgi:hypothetical protein
VKLKRVTSDSELSLTIDMAGMQAEQTVSATSLCAWKNIPRFLVAVDRAADAWNKKRDALTAELRLRTAVSPLQKIVLNDAFFVEKGCGSPKAFFAPILIEPR